MSLVEFSPKELAREVLGTEAVRLHAIVHSYYAASARTIRDLIAADLEGVILAEGKEFMRTRLGTWRVAMGANSDNSTERLAHERMGVGVVQVTGVTNDGALTLSRFYAIHDVDLDEDEFIGRLREAHQ